MKTMRRLLLLPLLTTSLRAAEPLYKQTGTDPSFAEVQASSGGKPGDRFNKGNPAVSFVGKLSDCSGVFVGYQA
jgi:hypothetical protein